MRNYCEILYSNLGRNSRRAAVWYEGETYSYEQLCGFVDGFSSFLFKRGVSRGDRVCVFLPNSLSLAVSVFSIARLGAACVPIDSACGTEEIKHCLEFSEPALIVTDESLAQTVAPVSGNIKTVSVTRDDFAGDAPAGPPGNSLADKAIYLFSTGSTGKPKCVARSHGNMIALARNHTATINWDSGDRILFSIPISHTYGLGNFVSAVSVGACCYFLPRFVRREVLGVLGKEEITVFPAVPFMLETLARSASRGDYDFPRLKHVISAGAPLAEETFFSFHSAFGTYPRQLYGSSETGVMTINIAENIVEKRLSVGAPAWRRLVGLLPSESAWWEEKVADHFLNPEALDPEILGLSASHFELPVKRLSSGERQRLGLLRLLDRQPEALLLDEPTANLDEESTRLVEALVLSYAREKSAPVIWVAHNTRQLERVADRLISFNRAGQVCEGRAS